MVSIVDRFINYALLMRLNRPIGVFLLLWPTLWALWIAGEGQPDMRVLIVFVLGVILMRSAGCVINDFADRKIDPLVQRTRHRPIATGRVTPKEALILFATLCAIAFSLVLLLNGLTIALSVVAILLAIIYPFMKRVTYMPQVVLGIAFAWAVPMVFAAQTGAIPIASWLLFVATVMWTVAYDTMYAMVDRDDDIKVGVKSTAILFGDRDRWIIASIQLSVIVILFIVGRQLALGWSYYLGLVVAVMLAFYQQYLIRDRAPSQCLKAFLNNNWFGAAIFLGVVLDYSWSK